VQGVLVPEDDVLELDIPVGNVELVQVSQSLRYPFHDLLDLL
jgi:hypothetical protein